MNVPYVNCKRHTLTVGGGCKYFFMFKPIWGKDSHFDEHIFQMGWFNHQPVLPWYLHAYLRLIAGVSAGKRKRNKASNLGLWHRFLNKIFSLPMGEDD